MFSLYNLDCHEYIIKTYKSSAQFVHPIDKKNTVKLKGNLIITSYSLIFNTLDINSDYSINNCRTFPLRSNKNDKYNIVKFKFEDIPDKPKIVVVKDQELLKFKVLKTIEIISYLQELKIHEYDNDVFIDIESNYIEDVLKLIYDVYQRYNNSLTFEFKDTSRDIYLCNKNTFNNNNIIYNEFDYSTIESINEQIILNNELNCTIILPLVEVNCILVITNEKIYFQTILDIDTVEVKNKFCINIKNINELYKRFVKLSNNGLEIIASDIDNTVYNDSKLTLKNRYLLYFENTKSRNLVYKSIVNILYNFYFFDRNLNNKNNNNKKLEEEVLNNTSISIIGNNSETLNDNAQKNILNLDEKNEWTKEDKEYLDLLLFNNKLKTNIEIDELYKYTNSWVQGAISNYEYLTILNSAANRTKQDIYQYPVFPWVLKDYESKSLNLDDISVFRDLSLPVGAFNARRLKIFKQRYLEMNEPKYLYKSNYSRSIYIINYLFRILPHLSIKQNNGKYYHSNKIFNSIKTDWNICNNDYNCFKELIPEFFEEDVSFLINTLNLNLGYNSKEERLDVILPEWSNSPYDFLKKMRMALESEYVSNNLHNWIDLIFGYKQTGKNALESNNVFNNICYTHNRNVKNYQCDIENSAIEKKAIDYGINPFQLFKDKHPKRYSNLLSSLNCSELSIIDNQDKMFHEKVNLEYKKNEEIDNIYFNNYDNKNSYLQALNKNLKSSRLNYFKTHNKNESPTKKLKYYLSCNFKYKIKCHYDKLTYIDIFDNIICSSGIDGFINIYNINNLYSFFKNNYHIDNDTLKENNFYDDDNYEFNQLNSANSLVKSFQLENCPSIGSVRVINNSIIAIGDNDGMMHIYNYLLNKITTSLYAHTNSIINIYNFEDYMLTLSSECCINKFSLNSNLKTPLNIYYDFNNKIISSDFRSYDNLLLTLDDKNIVSFKDCKTDCTISSTKTNNDSNINYVKYNITNLNEYFIASNSNLKIYDIRNNKEICNLDTVNNTIGLFNDYTNYLSINTCEVKSYNNKLSHNLSKDYSNIDLELIETFKTTESKISSVCNSNCNNFREDNISNWNLTCLGCTNGDMLFAFN